MEKQFVPVIPTEPTHVIPPKSSGLHPNDVTAAVVDSLKNKSRWVVNRAGDGLDLTWETGEQVLIQNSDGTVTPYSRTFQQLQEMGTPTKDWFGRDLKPQTAPTSTPAPQAAPQPQSNASQAPQLLSERMGHKDKIALADVRKAFVEQGMPMKRVEEQVFKILKPYYGSAQLPIEQLPSDTHDFVVTLLGKHARGGQ